jgi:hypothetical protein
MLQKVTSEGRLSIVFRVEQIAKANRWRPISVFSGPQFSILFCIVTRPAEVRTFNQPRERINAYTLSLRFITMPFKFERLKLRKQSLAIAANRSVKRMRPVSDDHGSDACV